MASILSILKNIINLNRVHIEKQEYVTTPTQRFGEIYEEKQLHIRLRPTRNYQVAVRYVGRSARDTTTRTMKRVGGELPI